MLLRIKHIAFFYIFFYLWLAYVFKCHSMKKEKYHLEYIFENISHKSIWRALSTDIGLKEWFADDVIVSDKEYQFCWNGCESETAIQIKVHEGSSVRYEWLKSDGVMDDEMTFIEFNIYTMELTGEKILEITDFASDDDRMDSIDLWDVLIGKMRKVIGSA